MNAKNTEKKKIPGFFEAFADILKMLRFFKRMHVDLHYLFFSAFLLGVLVFFHIYVIRLLYALIHGILYSQFEDVRQMFLLRSVIKIYPDGFASQNSLFMLLVGWYYCVAILQSLIQYIGQVMVAYQASNASSKIRELLFSRYLKFGKMFFDRTNIAHLNHTVIHATKGITKQITTSHRFFSQGITLVAYVGIMFWLSWKLTLVVLIIFPIMSRFSASAILKVRESSLSYHASLGVLNSKIFNFLTCVPLVKTLGKEQREFEIFKKLSGEEVQKTLTMVRLQRLVGPIREIGQVTALLLAAWALTFIAKIDHNLVLTKVIIFFYMAHRSVPLFGVFQQFQIDMSGLEGPIRMVDEVLSDEEKYIVHDGELVWRGLERDIEFRHLNFGYYEEVTVLKDICLHIQKGQKIAIVGRTGAGKTTLANLLLRLYDVQPGSLFLDGMDIRQFKNRSIRQAISYVSQEIYLFNDTIRANICYAAEEEVDDLKFESILRRAQLYDFVKSLPQKEETIVGDRGVKLSGGERQRIALARAMLQNTPILILDEATSALDSITEGIIQKSLWEAAANRTLIIIAHRLSTIRDADQIIVLDAGRVVEAGSPSELLEKKGKFYEYWTAQQWKDENTHSQHGKNNFVSFACRQEPSYSEACRKAVHEPSFFKRFRSSKPFTGIYENISEQYARQCLGFIKTLAPEILSAFDRFRTLDQCGGPQRYRMGEYGDFAGSTLRYIFHLAELKRIFDSLKDMKIIEIGGGYGGQYKILRDYFQLGPYTLVDLPEALNLTRQFLSHFGYEKINYCTSADVKKLSNQKFDLVISNYAFCLLEKETQSLYLHNILNQAERGYLKCSHMAPGEAGHRLDKEQLLKAVPGSREISHLPAAEGCFTWVWGKTAVDYRPEENDFYKNLIKYHSMKTE